MDKTIKVILLTNSERIISEIDEVGAEIGEPDCKLIKPYDVKDLVLKRFIDEKKKSNLKLQIEKKISNYEIIQN